MASPRVNLVIACWGGHRRTYHAEYENDRAYYLKLQMDSLSRFKHSLTDVTFVSNGGEGDYLKYLNRISGHAIIHRPNIGMSYGAFDAAWKKNGTYDYYIFLEDDYIFVRDDYDRTMVDIFEASENCGYLCQLVLGINRAHPAIFNGMASNDCLSRLCDLPGATATGNSEISYYGDAETSGQASWGHAVKRVGLELYGMNERFKAPYIGNQDEFLCWNEDSPEYIIVPAQIYEKVLENPDYIKQYETTDEDWRAFKAYYLWLRNVYLTDRDRKSVERVAAPFKIRTREDLARVASIYERSMRNAAV